MVEAIIKGEPGLSYNSGFMSTYNHTLKTVDTSPAELQDCNYRSMFIYGPDLSWRFFDDGLCMTNTTDRTVPERLDRINSPSLPDVLHCFHQEGRMGTDIPCNVHAVYSL